MKQAKELEQDLRRKIERIKRIRESKAILSKEELELSVPILKNLGMVGNIYDWIMDYHKGRKVVKARKQFIFVILYFYSPCSLGGTKMRRKLRKKIATVLGCTCSNVSHAYKDVDFDYFTYNDFRNDVNDIIIKLTEELDIKGEDN